MTGQEERLTGDAQVGGSSRRSKARQAPDSDSGTDRGYDERDVADDRDAEDQEFLDLFRESMHQSALPDLPPRPGFHRFWATTSNPRDTIAYRLRIGYRLVKVEELPGWENVSMKTGDYAGVVAINEMLAMEIPLSRYNRLMKYVHHDMPLEEEEKLRKRMDLMKDQARAMGSQIDEGDGTRDLVQKARPMPEFSA
jgi:hypothetical protein